MIHFIFFTNSEDVTVGSDDIYVVPRVISLTPSEFSRAVYTKNTKTRIYMAFHFFLFIFYFSRKCAPHFIFLGGEFLNKTFECPLWSHTPLFLWENRQATHAKFFDGSGNPVIHSFLLDTGAIISTMPG